MPFEAEVSYRDRPVMVLQEGDTHYAVVGISLGAKPGVHKITAGDERIAFTVEAKHYEEQRLTIASKRKVNPYAEDMDRIIREKRQINAAYTLFTSGAVETSFSLPVMGRTSSPFGLRRFLNGQRRSPHSGLDIAAPEGEVISAPASGTVAVTGDFFFTGYTVMVDHGQGLITLYSHLSKIEVAVGDELAAGDLIGLVGKTGRVTGAHLHWGVSLNNARVNPELFLVP